MLVKHTLNIIQNKLRSVLQQKESIYGAPVNIPSNLEFHSI